MNDNMKKVIKIGCIGFGIFIFLLVLIVSIGSCGARNSTTPVSDDVVANGDKYELIVYKSSDGICYTKSSSCNKIPFKIEVNTDSAKIVGISDKDLFLLYDDNGLYLFDTNKKVSTKIDLENKYSNYSIIVDNNIVKGIVYGNSESNVNYYNVNSKSNYYVDKYNSIEYSDGYLVGRSISDSKSYLLDMNSEKVLTSGEYNSTYKVNKFSSFNIYEVINSNKVTLVSNDGSVLFSDLNSTYYSVDLNGYIYIYNGDNTVKVYNRNGNYAKTVFIEGTYKDLIINYVVVIRNNKICLKNINNSDTYVEVGNWLDSYTYYYNSDYYTDGYLFGNNEQVAGIYILVQRDKASVKGIEHYYNIKNGTVKEYSISDYREGLVRK